MKYPWLKFITLIIFTLFFNLTYHQVTLASTNPQLNPKTTSDLVIYSSYSPAAITPDNSQLVDIQSINKKIVLDIRYATPNNFLKKKLYTDTRCILRNLVAKKLSQVQEELTKNKLGLKVYDCYRPLSIQKLMWKMLPNENYIANPSRGSRHNRGAAVDLTLVDSKGKELKMPSEFDTFTPASNRNYNGGTPESRKNRQLLQDAMQKYGFVGLPTEWWHFDASGWEKFPVIDASFSAIPRASN
ncbi:M15 family metallopeptidase [Cylindrospermum sp. FACHB-282]|uniref:M15 family metallopeptidase n=1 Tax=Cylindrospermum sp. FACHB-282 TaxID=2692794 RepID=UPI0016850EAB|nr:M15 family metallopeptidase [Cylindrospermum sp. FACHB-282]MBD2385804.1 M15 family metallopeptidase [Cylindrospermum sp. FACHB-282]